MKVVVVVVNQQYPPTKVTNVAQVNEEVDQAALIERLQAENRRLKEEGGLVDNTCHGCGQIIHDQWLLKVSP